MQLADVRCPCGSPIEPRQDDAGVYLACAAGCGLVAAAPAPNVQAAIEEWFAAVPPPSVAEALETYVQLAARTLVHAETSQELVHLAPLAEVLISYQRLQSARPVDEPPP